ncbi:MAG: hypothetical protein MJZ15_03835 [Bacteroidales bacterium]|nr:hypothetical protein [Bacteroidales bacterium]
MDLYSRLNEAIRNAIQEALECNDDINHRVTKLKSALRTSQQYAINEIGHRLATRPMGINMCADNKIDKGNDVYIAKNGKQTSLDDIREKSSKISYDILTQGVKDNIGDSLVLNFGRPEVDRTTSSVRFVFDKMRLLTDKRFVMEGFVTTSRSPNPLGSKKPKRIQIDYLWNEQQFYEAVYCANGSVRHLAKLKLNQNGVRGQDNITTACNLIGFLTQCLYCIDDYLDDIANNRHI